MLKPMDIIIKLLPPRTIVVILNKVSFNLLMNEPQFTKTVGSTGEKNIVVERE